MRACWHGGQVPPQPRCISIDSSQQAAASGSKEGDAAASVRAQSIHPSQQVKWCTSCNISRADTNSSSWHELGDAPPLGLTHHHNLANLRRQRRSRRAATTLGEAADSSSGLAPQQSKSKLPSLCRCPEEVRDQSPANSSPAASPQTFACCTWQSAAPAAQDTAWGWRPAEDTAQNPAWYHDRHRPPPVCKAHCSLHREHEWPTAACAPPSAPRQAAPTPIRLPTPPASSTRLTLPSGMAAPFPCSES